MLDGTLIRDALEALGRLCGPGEAVEMLLAGGAGGLLAGELPDYRTTVDCDVMVCAPDDAWPGISEAAGQVAVDLNLAEAWLNNGAQSFREALLPGWEGRRREIARAGRLIFFAPGRVDFIAAKAIAGRPQDLEDLQALDVTSDEWEFVREHLKNWTHDHWPESLLREALLTIDEMEGV